MEPIYHASQNPTFRDFLSVLSYAASIVLQDNRFFFKILNTRADLTADKGRELPRDPWRQSGLYQPP